MIDRKTAAILALLVLVAITGAGWVWTASRPERVLPLPVGIENWTQYFRGYDAYIGREVYASVVHGTSMQPTLSENDLIMWVEVNPSELRVGDIILFKHPTVPSIDNVAHRIVEVDVQDGEYEFRTAGDNNSGPDLNLVPAGNVHGLVIGVVYHASSG